MQDRKALRDITDGRCRQTTDTSLQYTITYLYSTVWDAGRRQGGALFGSWMELLNRDVAVFLTKEVIPRNSTYFTL
jgi:hypothetical protein